MKTIILFIIWSFIFISCSKVLNIDENLTLQRKNYNGNELKTDGYYYVFDEETNTTDIYCLYRNGIIITVGGYLSHNLDEIEKEIVNEKLKSKDHWGVFIVEGNIFQYERWIGSTGFRACLSKSTGCIKNDTTINITERYNSERNETYSVNEVWHFKSFSLKPDSTNNYIK